MLNLKDENIKFFNNGFEKTIIKNEETFIYKAYLDYKPACCPHCDADYEKNITIHAYRERKILLPRISNFKTILYLKIQRYKCKCGMTFSQETSIVNKGCFISDNTKIAIALDAGNKTSEKDIASRHNVSHNTCSRVINGFYDFDSLKTKSLPEVLSFDEFKSVKGSVGAMSFIMVDSVNKKILDIVEDRRLHKLKKYFDMYPKEVRDNVKFISIDMYSPYISLIKSHFKNAKIVFDRFHVVNLLSRELNKCRIDLMKKFKTSSNEYKILKKHYKLVLKKEWELDSINFRKVTGFKNFVSHKTVVEFILGLDECLKNTYDVYQNILRAVRDKSVNLLEKEVFDKSKRNIFDGMKTSLQTLKKYFEYVKNAVEQPYSNGFIVK